MVRPKRRREDGVTDFPTDATERFDMRIRTLSAIKTPRTSGLAADLTKVSEADYAFVNGLRYVLPYRHEFKIAFKERWRGRRVIDVFADEFSHTNVQYWLDEMQAGRVLKNGALSNPQQRWIDGDNVVHIVHRHESPVLDREIHVVFEDDCMLVVNKPPSMPCHPCGTYRKNSLIYILASKEWRDLRIIHRLDKQTSGIVVFAKTKDYARKLTKCMVNKEIQKRYLARVRGHFPREVKICKEPLAFSEKTMRGSVDHATGKHAETIFNFLSYDVERENSIVLCTPTTGRTHQIRLHLQHLGHPIVNDPVYMAKAETTLENGNFHCPKDNLSTLDGIHSLRESNKIQIEGKELACANCPFVANTKGCGQSDMAIDLHAYEYEIDGTKFTSSPPEWAAVPNARFQVAESSSALT